MKTALQLSFLANALDGNYYKPLFDEYVKFTPYSVTKKYNGMPWDEKKHLKLIAKAKAEDDLIIISKNNDVFSVGKTGTRRPHHSLNIVQDREIFFPSESSVEKMISKEGFIAGYIYNDDYEIVQSTPFSSNYNYRNFSPDILNSLKGVPYEVDYFENKEYDISNNPGKSDLIGYCWLIAAWRMWFGPLFFDLVPKEKIMSFEGAYRIEELPDGKIFVQLFEKIEDSAVPKNMEIQRKWRQWLNFDQLIETYK